MVRGTVSAPLRSSIKSIMTSPVLAERGRIRGRHSCIIKFPSSLVHSLLPCVQNQPVNLLLYFLIWSILFYTFYASLEKGSILFCNCRSVCEPCVVRSISSDHFNWSIPNLVQGLPWMSRWSLLIFWSHFSKVKVKPLFWTQCDVFLYILTGFVSTEKINLNFAPWGHLDLTLYLENIFIGYLN